MSCRARMCCLTGEYLTRLDASGRIVANGDSDWYRPVKSAQTLNAGVFGEGVLKVFRNTLTNDLRFYCKVDRESETYWSMSTS